MMRYPLVEGSAGGRPLSPASQQADVHLAVSSTRRQPAKGLVQDAPPFACLHCGEPLPPATALPGHYLPGLHPECRRPRKIALKRLWQAAHRETENAARRRYRLAHLEAERARNRIYRTVHAYRLKVRQAAYAEARALCRPVADVLAEWGAQP